MATLRGLTLLMVLGSVGFAGELVTLDNKKLNGDIVAVNGEELTFKSAAGQEKFQVTSIASITVGPAPKNPASGVKYGIVELTDGSAFRFETVSVDAAQFELKLLAGRTIKIPRTTIFSLYKDMANAKLEQEFRGLVKLRGKYDMYIFRKKDGADRDTLDAFNGTFDDGDKAAETIKFTAASPDGMAQPVQNVKFSRVEGMVFNQAIPVKLAATICRVIDTDGNVYAVQKITRTTTGYSLVTVTDVKFDLEENQVSKFDFAAGAVKYLSDLDPMAVLEEGSDPHPYQKDRNLDRLPIEFVLDAKTGKREKYAKGLTLHAKTTLTYNLAAQYKTFAALVGVDADKNNEAKSVAKVTIDDGTKVLWTGVVKSGEKPVELNLSVQNAAQLRIIVESDGPGLDLGNHASFANVRVLK